MQNTGLNRSVSKLLLFCLFLGYTVSAAAQDLPASTVWEGEVMGIPLVLQVKKDSLKNQYIASFDSPAQGAMNLAVSDLSISTDSLKAFSKVINGGFFGQFNSDKSKLTGTWQQGGGVIPMVFKRVEKPTELNRPQTPKAPFPYREENVTYSNADKSISFGGTLTLPQSDKPLPVVLLITGSGQQDRDESLFGHKPFLVIADHLSRAGIAVLRVDDRGIGETSGDAKQATSADFAQDVLAGINYLKSRKDIDHKQIGLIGHSEGGMIAPMVALESPDVAFIVSMAGVGVKGKVLLRKQFENLYASQGFNAEEIKVLTSLSDLIFQLNEDYPVQEELKAAFEPAFRKWRKQQPEDVLIKAKLLGEGSDEIIGQMAARMFSPWMRYFLNYEPENVLTKIKIPVLAINGEKDMQVDAATNLAGFEKHLKQAGNQHYKIVSLPNLNHLFQTATSGAVSEYALIEETIAPETLKVITDWIKNLSL